MKLISILMILVAGVFYQICARSIPTTMNSFASLILVYSSALIGSLVMYYIFGKSNESHSLFNELRKTNWAPFLLGIVLIVYESGFVLAYRSGFKANELSTTNAVLLMIAMIIVGRLAYQENISWKIILGTALAISGVIITKL